jgi:hypothetical protein
MNPSPSSPEAPPAPVSATQEITLECFGPYVGEKFDLLLGEGRSEPLELVSARSYNRKAPPGFREPFELIFRAGTRNFYVPQGIFAFQHPAAGSFEIFIVPIGPDDAGMQFQAVYN